MQRRALCHSLTAFSESDDGNIFFRGSFSAGALEERSVTAAAVCVFALFHCRLDRMDTGFWRNMALRLPGKSANQSLFCKSGFTRRAAV